MMFLTQNFLFAKEKMPLWITDFRSVFSDEKFLAFMGEGKKKAEAKNEALEKLAGYFKTSINAVTNTSLVLEANDGGAKEKINVSENIEVKSSAVLSCVEYSEVYRDKKNRKYYVVAFIEREKAWKLLEGELEAEGKNIRNLVQTSVEISEKDILLAKRFFRNVKKAEKNYLEMLEYASLISPAKSNAYYREINYICETESEIIENLSECSFYVSVEQDWLGFLKRNIFIYLFQKGFQLSDEKSDTNYKVIVTVNEKFGTGDNGTETEFYFWKPSGQIQMINSKTNEVILAEKMEADKELVSFRIERIFRDGYQMLFDCFKQAFEKLII